MSFQVLKIKTSMFNCGIQSFLFSRDRYVSLGSSRSKYSFAIPADGCGTLLVDGGQSNILVFQSDPIVQVKLLTNQPKFVKKIEIYLLMQEIWDMSRRISCQMTEKITKYVTWSPITVDMLDVQNDRADRAGEVDCWMDVFKGIYPNVRYFLFLLIMKKWDILI